MALQSGIGLSKIVFIVGAGYTGTILLKNNKLSELLGELQNLVKGLENSGDSANGDIDPIAAQVRWLAQELRQLTNTRQVTVVNGSSSQTDLSSLILPAATLGALGYGYMWWNGLSFSDLMYVTKRSMAVAVESLQENLQGVHAAVEKAKKHLLQRVQNLDKKIDEQRELQNQTLNEVRSACGNFEKVQKDLHLLEGTVRRLEGKMDDFGQTQALTHNGVEYLVNFVEERSTEAPALTQTAQEFRSPDRARGLLPPSENLGLQGLLSIY